MTLSRFFLTVMLGTAVVRAKFATHVARQALQLPDGAVIEQTAASLLAPTAANLHFARQATQLSDGAAIEQTAASLILPTETATTDSNAGLQGIDDVASNVTTWAWLWGWHDCTNGQKSAILNGLSEAHTVLGTDGVYNIRNHWNDYAAVEYLGSPWALKQRGHRETVEHNFNKAYGYQQSWFSWYDTQPLPQKPGYIALDNKFDSHGLALFVCPRYFRLGTLEDIYSSAQSSKSTRLELTEYENRARAWITTIMRVRWIANLEPQKALSDGSRGGPLIESASQCKWLSKNWHVPNVILEIVGSPSNYAWYALAQWVQQKSGHYATRPQTPMDLGPPW